MSSACRRDGEPEVTSKRDLGTEWSFRLTSLLDFRPPSSPRPLVARRAASFRPEVDVDGETTKVMVEQLGAVDVERLGEAVGHLRPQEVWEVEDALLLVLDLPSSGSRPGV